MQHLQRYLFGQLVPPLLVACATLAALAILTQTLSTLSLMIREGETFLLVARIVALTLPQLMALVLPVALFIAVAQTLYRLRTDSELVVMSVSGLSRWGVLSPILRLTVIVMAAQLALGLWAQPWGHREMRRLLHDARVEMASSLFQPGEFTRPSEDLTIYVQSIDPNGVLHEVRIEDRRSGEQTQIYLADRGRLVESATSPAVILEDGSIQTLQPNGLYYATFATNVFHLAQFVEPPGQLLYKLSDRFVYELMYPNLAHYWELANRDAMLAEAHARLAAPLHNLAMALIAAWALLGGNLRRLGYARRIGVAALCALTVRVLGFTAQAAGAGEPAANALQYLTPLAASAIFLSLIFGKLQGGKLRERKLRRPVRARRGLPGAPA